MAVDGAFEQQSVLLRAQANLVGGRVYSSVPDDQVLERSGIGAFKPYIVVSFGSAYAAPNPGDRSIMGEEEQPHILPIRMQAWASNDAAARATAGAIRDEFIGWTPSPGSSQIRSGGSGSNFANRGTGASPSRYVERVLLECEINLGSNDGYVPSPGDSDPDGGVLVESVQDIIAEYLATHSLAYERHVFSTPSGQWYMVHGLGRIPTVTTYDSQGVRLLTDYTATTEDVTVTWANPQDGFVILT